VTLLRVTLLPSPSEVVVSRTVEPPESFDVRDLTEDVDFFDPDEEDDDPDDFEDEAFDEADFEAGAFEDADFDDAAFEAEDWVFELSDAFGLSDAVALSEAELSADVDPDGAAALEPDGSAASVPSVDSRVVVTSIADASAERVVVCVVRERSVGSVRVERVVTDPVDGSTARARVVTTPVDGSVSVEELPSGDVVTRGAAAPDGAAPVVVVIPSDDPGGASVDAGPSVGIGQPSGCAPDPFEARPEPVVGASGESLPPVPGARVDPVPVAVASPGRSAVAGAADEEDGGSELLGPSIGIGQPSGATAGTATAGVCFAPPSCPFAAPPSFFFGVPPSFFFGVPPGASIFGSSTFGVSAFFGGAASGSFGASAFLGGFASGASACGAAAVRAPAPPWSRVGSTPPRTWPGRSCTRGGAAIEGLPGAGLDAPPEGGTIGASGAAALGDGACEPGTIGASGGSQPDGVLDAGAGALPRGRAPGSGIGVSGGASESSAGPGSDGAAAGAPPPAGPPYGAGATEVPRSAPGAPAPGPTPVPGPGP
jgi:hypothetical protein